MAAALITPQSHFHRAIQLVTFYNFVIDCSLADYLQNMAEETIAIPCQLRHYIDWEAMARDA